MACPEGHYADILETSDGLTPENPYTFVPNIFAMSDWFAIAERVITRAEAAWRKYSEYKPPETWTAEETKTWNQLNAEFSAIKQRYGDVESPWNLLDWTHSSAGSYITDLVNISVDAACMWQQIDQSLSDMGGTPIGPPDPKALPKNMTLFEKALLVGGLIGGGALLIYGARTLQNRQGSTP